MPPEGGDLFIDEDDDCGGASCGVAEALVAFDLEPNERVCGGGDSTYGDPHT
tara:strand:- start:686 stop:841 length:156 start_codon:yes stop_codon:yes gene_type:complete